MRLGTAVATAVMMLAGCAPFEPDGAGVGHSGGSQQLPLATPCSFATGVVAIVLAANEQATLTLDGSSRLTVNGALCSSASASTIARITVTSADQQSLSDERVVLDATGGWFALGTAQAVGLTISLGAGSGDSFEVIGTSGDDALIAGYSPTDTWVTTNHDLFKDISVTGAESITLTGKAGNDLLSGTSRNPLWVPSSAFSTGFAARVTLVLQGGDGADTLIGGESNDALFGGDGDDVLVGSLGNDSENGEVGDDSFDEGAASNGADVVIGSTGTDWVSYAARALPVVVTLGSGANDGAVNEADDLRSDIETVTGGTGADTLSCAALLPCTLNGGPGDDSLFGRGGVDTLNGETGNDLIQVGAGAGLDVVNGGPGVDTVSYGEMTSAVTVTLDVTVTGIENLIGSDFNDTLVGNALDNAITGGMGDDTLDGAAGNDTFLEGSSADGADTFTGGSGEDRVDYSGRTLALTVTMDGAAANDGEANEHDRVMADVENVSGGSANDSLTGNASGNKLDGNAGADTLNGLAGNDELTGGPGFDVLNGGDGDDVLEASADSAVCDCGDGFDIAVCDSAPTNCEVR